MDPVVIGAIIAGVTALASTIYSNRKNQENADKQYEYQKYLNSNQTQIQTADFQKAGLNPALAGMSGANLSTTNYNSNQQGFDLSGLASAIITSQTQKKINDDTNANQKSIVDSQNKSAEKIASEKVQSEEDIAKTKIKSEENIALAKLNWQKEVDKPVIELNKIAVSQSPQRFTEELKKLRSDNAISQANAINMCLKNAIQTVTGRDDGLGIPNLQVGNYSFGSSASANVGLLNAGASGSFNVSVTNADIINALKQTSNMKNEKAIYKTFKENLENAGLPVPSYVNDRLRDSTIRYNGAKLSTKRHN